MKNRTIAIPLALSAFWMLQACGGGSGGGDIVVPFGAAPVSAPSFEPASASAPTADTSISPTPVPTHVAVEGSIRRALDTINPVAVNGNVDIELSSEFASAPAVTYSLENLDGTSAGIVTTYESTAGSFFPRAANLVNLLMPQVAPGSYMLKAKGQIMDEATSIFRYVEATMPIRLNALSVNLASVEYSSRLIVGGSLRTHSINYTSAVDGILYSYPTGRPSDVCEAKTVAELEAIPNVQIHLVDGRASSMHAIVSAHPYADADTNCLQFVRARDSVAEAPYTFNLRYESLPTSGDLLLVLDGRGATAPKKAVSLLSVPWGGNFNAVFDWLERRQVFTSGDVLQQSISNSSRISLEKVGQTWQYRLKAPLETDPPFYVAKIEGQPPTVFFIRSDTFMTPLVD